MQNGGENNAHMEKYRIDEYNNFETLLCEAGNALGMGDHRRYYLTTNTGIQVK